MIQIEEISQKFTRIYHTVDDIKNFALRIRLIDETSPDDEDVSTFKWQQKRFSHQERERFQRAENCLTDLDKEYHQQILKETRRGRGTQHSISTIFSYVEKDGHTPPEINFTRKSRKNPAKPDNEDIQHNMLNKMMDKLYLHSKDEETDAEEEENEEKTKNFDYFDLLSENIKNPVLNMDFSDSTETKTFYIMADFGEYYNSTWLPSEYILCTISYNSQSKMLKITPDFTTFDGYQLKVTSDETKTYTYFIENASLDGVTRKNSEINKEVLILNQMNSSAKTNITHLQLEHLSWNLSKDTAYIHVVLEILSGWNFENDNVFVRYWLVLNGWQLKNVENSNGDNLQGVTIASKS
ncbi:tectonic-like complex member MKS1, partial [Atheta coriaria]|uniref:tectonic-like complex member MKS1 n=1 Tax=Dalotia coriaria TaxID=877792 RepID=UPI0031F38722